ncbi:DUF4142 domain-containing protein [Rufibacter roseus]|uniref:DUF4142 domain-containing protein n=1 Tax=Rufibacter roseus TaxID=1567108 RepID=A0ABW2DG72_9BACT|nr:DUF4142 domain-containing protein [Rufibacter roseus]
MKNYLSTLCCSAALLFMTSCGGSSDSTSVDAAGKHNENLLESTGKSEKAGWFVAETASSNLYLQEMGRLASSKATDPQIKEFGQVLLSHHEQLNNQLKQISDLKNLMTPSSMGNNHQKAFNQTLEQTGQEFDKAFIEKVEKEHEDLIEKFQEFTEDGADAEYKNFASQALPTLQAHQKRAQALKDAQP